MRKIIPLITALLYLTACSCKTIFPNNSETWKHEIEYSRKGTKSEARHGYLYYKGNQIPDCFTSITIPSKTYYFFSRDMLWGDDGYFESSEPLILIKSNLSISDAVKTKGYYLGLEKLEGTPAYWVFVQWDGGKAYVDPMRFDVLIKEQKLKTLPRDNLYDKLEPMK